MNLYQHNELFLYTSGICLTQMQQKPNSSHMEYYKVMRINKLQPNNMSDSHKQKVD